MKNINEFSIHDVPNEHVFRTESNHWFKIYWHSETHYTIFNDLGTRWNYWEGDKHGKIIQIEKDFLGIRENESFELVLPKNVTARNIPGNGKLLFRTSIGSRVVCEMENYKFKIPFWFKTTDPRVEKAESFWKNSSGKVFQLLVNSQLSIQWENNKVILNLNSGLTTTIPS